ncbi:MAG: hypothetical protein HY236_05875 [Acidobacteria bacterium]|nr:hypothetical protein [Acidobacteriota bacterium]
MPQATVTAETGTVAHPEKSELPASTESVQLLALLPPLTDQVTVAGLLPVTLPRSGSVAVKVIVPGLAVMEPTLAAAIVGGVKATGAGRRRFSPFPKACTASNTSKAATRGEIRSMPQSQVALIVYLTVAE